MDVEVLPYVIPLSAQKPKTLTLVPSEPDSRYQVRQLQVQVVGKSKMIRTVLVNILDVAKDMLIPPSYIGTFMGYVLGAQSKFDSKKPERQQASLSGERDTKELSKIMVQFINEVISCPKCKLPEITIKIKGKNVYGNCRSCGEKSPLSITDEKFKRYIINHPPTSSKDEFQGNKQTNGKDSKKKDKDKEKEKRNKEGTTEANGENDENGEAEAPKPAKQKKSKPKSSEEPIVWYSDTSEEAAKKRREAMVPESMLDFTEFEDDVKKLVSENASPEKMKSFKGEKYIKDEDFVILLFTALFNDVQDLQKGSTKFKSQLEPFLKDTQSQVSLTNCIARFAIQNKAKLLKKLPLILKAYYDEDLLEEEALLKWYDSKTSSDSIKEAKNAAKPFIKWLKEAEEESESEEEEEENESEEPEEEDEEEED